MDERQWSFKRLIKIGFLCALAAIVLVGAYGGFVYFRTQQIVNPNSCFTTKMFKVNLCSTNPSYVRYKDVPKHFYHSLILSEDASFYSHKGFDWFEIKESFRRNFVEWKFARGGSTLTQQLAKNLYLTQDKTLDRKFKEFFIARQIEKKLSKPKILEKYINVVEFGNGIYGLRKASENYFSKSPALLNVLESVYLVSLLPNPKRLGQSYSSRSLSRENKWRMEIILKRLYRTKKITDEVFVYLKMLIETEAWPFDHYSEEFFNQQRLSIEEQMMLEFEGARSDEEFLEEPTTLNPQEAPTDEELVIEAQEVEEPLDDAEPVVDLPVEESVEPLEEAPPEEEITPSEEY